MNDVAIDEEQKLAFISAKDSSVATEFDQQQIGQGGICEV